MSKLNLWIICTCWTSVIQTAVCADPHKPHIEIKTGGATLPVDVYKVWRPMYQSHREQYAEVDIFYQPIGSADGIKRFEDNSYDFAASDISIPEESYGNVTNDIQMFPTMAGTISIAYNVPEMPFSCIDQSIPNNPSCLNLTREAIVGIFNGTIRTWNHPALSAENNMLRTVNETITVILRADPAGATDLLTSTLSAFSPEWKAAYGTFLDGCTIRGVPLKWNNTLNHRCGSRASGATGLILNTQYSIGYCGSSDSQGALLPEARLLNRANQWISPSVEATEAAMNSQIDILGSHLTGSLVDAPARDAYPIVGYSYFLMRKKTMQNCTIAQEIYRFFKYVLDDRLAKSVVRDVLKAPISDSIYTMISQQVLDKFECRGKKVANLVAVTMSIEDGTFEMWKTYVAITLSVLLIAGLIGGGAFGYVQYVENKQVLTSAYILHIDYSDEQRKSTHSFVSGQHSHSRNGGKHGFGDAVVRLANGERCLSKPLCKHLEAETLTWKTRKLLVHLKDRISSTNVVKVLGISKKDNDWKMIMACPSKGRLQDIIHAGKYQLDAGFRYAIAKDLAEGMSYLHKHEYIHGQLTTNNCYIDARWNSQVGDWEQYSLHRAQKLPFTAFETQYRNAFDTYPKDPISLNRYCRLLYWSASDLLVTDVKNLFSVNSPTKEGDVYSFGVLAYEVFTSLMPFENLTAASDSKWQPSDVVKTIKTDRIKPSIPDELFSEYPKIGTLLDHTWEPEPSFRPTFADIKKTLKSVNPKHESIVDTMIQAVENYASSLEEKVMERTLELEKITQNMETLLHNMLPPSIADKLAKGENVAPEYYDSVTICFSDIVGFTSLAAASSPIDIVNLLNGLYTTFDSVISTHDVYKVETIGDSYMCISGLPKRNGMAHATEVGTMALDMLSAVGLKMPRYCLFGDAVNTAARMESSSLPMRIQISDETKLILDLFEVYEIYLRGERAVKGKGKIITHWLVGKVGYIKSLPEFDPADDDRLLDMLDVSQIK